MDLLGFRTALGLTLEAVAYAVGSTKGTISKIERGKLIPRGDLMMRVSAWAEEERKKRHLPASYRLTWDQLLARPEEAC